LLIRICLSHRDDLLAILRKGFQLLVAHGWVITYTVKDSWIPKVYQSNISVYLAANRYVEPLCTSGSTPRIWPRVITPCIPFTLKMSLTKNCVTGWPEDGTVVSPTLCKPSQQMQHG
jgi:hypothetical protein